MYQALYRKWRPSTFRDVVGQPQVTETLRRQVATGRLSHAYLFTGTRGTGKTTCAKLLAKAANCERPKDGEPCNECRSCIGINEGSIVDVFEIDAASNSGVENIRAIREQTAYTPVEARYRVYIIDECHMLSPGAFNALLKTLEEPPSHVLFILATTELHKVPATILSRCQRFAFRRLSVRDLTLRLLEVASGEGITLDESGAMALARLADGAARDAISMLDQCAAIAGGAPLDEEVICGALGLAGTGDALRVAQAVAAGDTATALAALDELYMGGKDAAAFISELGVLLRDALIITTTGDASLISGAYSAHELRALSFDSARLCGMLTKLGEAQVRLTRSVNKRLDIEICLIELCAGNTSTASITSTAPKLTAPAASMPKPAVVPSAPADDSPPWKVHVEPPKAAEPPKPIEPPEPAQQRTESAADWWEETMSVLHTKLPTSTFMQLSAQPPAKLDGDIVVLRISDFAKLLIDGKVLEIIAAAASDVLGRRVTAKTSGLSDEPAPSQGSIDELMELQGKFDNFTVE